MQWKRVQGLCFNYNENFLVGHKCREPQLLLLENYIDIWEGFHKEEGGEEVIEEAHNRTHATVSQF